MIPDLIAVPFASSWLALLLRLALASVFLMAGLTKLAEGAGFVENVRKYGILPGPLAVAYARSLPLLELAAALALFVGFYAWAVAGLVTVLLLSFIVAVSVAIRRRLNLDCSCFGLLYRERVGYQTLARDGVLLAFALYVLLFDDGRFAMDRLVASLPASADIAALLLTVLALSVGIMVSWQTIRSGNARPAAPAAASLEATTTSLPE